MTASNRPLLAELAAVTRRLGDLRARSAVAPLGAAALADLQRAAATVSALVPRLAAAAAVLDESRGLELAAVRAALATARQLDLDAPMAVVAALDGAGRVRSAGRAYLAFIRRAPRDEAWGDRLAGLGHLLERRGELRGAGMCRALVSSLLTGWWRGAIERGNVEHALGELVIVWDQLPEAV